MIRVSRLLSIRAIARKPGLFLACLVLIAGVFSSACDSSTAPSLVVQNLILSLASTQLPSQGGTVTIVANLTNGSGKPMPGVAVTFTATAGTFAPATPVTTDAAGQASVQLTTTTGTTFKASAMGIESAATAISVKGQATVTITAADGTDLPNGVSLPFDFTARRNGAPVSGTLVVSWGDGTANAGTAFTGNGRLEHRYEKGGTYNIQATLTETDSSRASASTSVKIREGLDQIDISKAIMVSKMDDEGVVKWPIDSELTQIYVDGGQTCLDHTMNGKWPAALFEPPDGGLVEGTHIIFATIGGQVYGGVYDYYRPGQTCKATNKWQYGEEQIRSPPMGSWVPAMGEIVGFMASTPARGGYNTINHRTYVKAFVFPY